MWCFSLRSLSSFISGLIGLVLGFSLLIAPAFAAPTDKTIAPLSQTPIEVRVSLGNVANELKFEPSQFEFTVGKRYKLLLNNPSASKHYFTSKDFADVIWTQKVEAGKVEVKGAIHEVELKPEAQAEWVFVPIKPGEYELHCSVPGHTEAGMIGKIIVSS
jgi:uncharacterized cupredoxin-like copper-binding protein